MRVMVVRPGPHFSVADVANGWVGGLREMGCTVVDLNFDDKLGFYAEAHRKDPDTGDFRKLCDDTQAATLANHSLRADLYDFCPDVVLIVSGFYVFPWVMDLIRARGAKVVLLHTESPYEDERQARRAEHADLNLLNDPTNIDAFPNAHYFAHCYDPAVHHPRPWRKERSSDFCFVGSGYPSRIQFFEKVDWSGLDVVLAGNWQALTDASTLAKYVIHPRQHCLDNTEAVDFYTSTKASANLYRREAENDRLADGWSMGPREVELAACGTFYLTEERGENREVLPWVPTFEKPDDFGEQLRWWLDRPDQRAAIIEKSRAAIADRTFANSARRLLELLSD